jgi:predicted RNA-binding Zn-ribbon protein involved in translation (DUF1610 family)
MISRLSVPKDCEVCGGHVKPIDAQSVFGYCEKCGLVYALRDRLEQRSTTAAKAVESGQSGETREEERVGREAPSDAEQVSEAYNSRWRCPDCGALLQASNESDLQFVKREHIREYHPNRALGQG